LNVFEINRLVAAGPNLRIASGTGKGANYTYLSSQWYQAKY
jgi:hypothetical protein